MPGSRGAAAAIAEDTPSENLLRRLCRRTLSRGGCPSRSPEVATMKHSRLFAAVAFLLPSLLLAQAQGRVKGTVTDTAGKVIVGATVTVTSTELTTFKKVTSTDKRGEFTVLFVDATKRYKFLVEAKGFQGREEVYKPLIGHQTLDVEFKLKSASEVEAEQEQSVLAEPGYKELGEAKELLDAGKRDDA